MDEIKERLAALGCEYVSGEYITRKSCITIRCRCGHVKTLRVNTAFTNNFSGLCSKCSVEEQHKYQRLSLEEVQVLAAAKGLRLLSEEYKNAREQLSFECSCGRQFSTTWDSIHSGKKKPMCDVCSKRISGGELAVEGWLVEHGYDFEKEKTFEGCGRTRWPYRFDFYIPTENACIEFDGQQHYKLVDYSGTGETECLTRVLWDTQSRDKAKEKFCSENGIKLIRIAYYEIESISDKLSDMLIPR